MSSARNWLRLLHSASKLIFPGLFENNWNFDRTSIHTYTIYSIPHYTTLNRKYNRALKAMQMPWACSSSTPVWQLLHVAQPVRYTYVAEGTQRPKTPKQCPERIQSRQRQARTKPSKPHMICRTPNVLRCWASSFSCRIVRSCNHRPEIPKKQTRVSGGINIVHWCSLVGHQPGHHIWCQLIRRTTSIDESATVTLENRQ